MGTEQEVKSRMFTEEEIRAIVKEEIQSVILWEKVKFAQTYLDAVLSRAARGAGGKG